MRRVIFGQGDPTSICLLAARLDHDISFTTALRSQRACSLLSFVAMRRILVDEKRSIGEARVHALNYQHVTARFRGPTARDLYWLALNVPSDVVVTLLTLHPGNAQRTACASCRRAIGRAFAAPARTHREFCHHRARRARGSSPALAASGAVNGRDKMCRIAA